MQIANRLAGFSLGDADLLRRAMGKKKHEEMAAQREKFLAGCAARKVHAEEGRKDFRSDGRIRRLRFQQVALLRLRLARLSDRLPEDSLSRGIHGRDAQLRSREHRKSGEVHQRSARHGHSRPAAGRASKAVCTSRRCGDDIRFGLAAIKNVGENTAKAICEARAAETANSELLRFLRSDRTEIHQQARARKPDQGRRARLPGRIPRTDFRRHRSGAFQRGAEKAAGAKPSARADCSSATSREHAPANSSSQKPNCP